MCGISVSKGEPNIDYVHRRGQDQSTSFVKGEYLFQHFLLSVTGDNCIQPYLDGNIVMVYNGEIYNQPYEDSDGECIIPLYKKYGYNFARYLDGEFAIALYDFDKKVVVFATDPFGTKPLWVNATECGSYESVCGGEKLPANTIRVVDFDDITVLERETVKFDFDNQIKNSYADWIKAFEIAVKKRAKDNCFVGLSSGYDSGAIVSELLKLKTKFKAFSVKGHEDLNILEQRRKLCKEFEYVDVDRTKYKNWIDEKVEPFKYRMKHNGNILHMGLHDDKASIGFAAICDKANKEGRKVHLSGQGADEIMSDYSTFPSQSELKGVYPEQLTEWFNFRDGGMYSYLGKEEYVGGSFNIESRYPFLDRNVVQEFLFLTPELKNKFYKAPLQVYLDNNKFPYIKGKKVGFNI